MATRSQLLARRSGPGPSKFDPDANMPRINRKMVYLTSGIGRSVNSRRPLITYRISVSALDHALTEIRRFQMAEKPPSTDNFTPFM